MKRIPGIAMFIGIVILGSCSVTKKVSKENAAGNVTNNEKQTDTFATLPSGLEYKIVKHGTGTRKPVIGDHIEMNIHVHEGDSVIFDSRKMNDNKPVPWPIAQARYKGDLVEGFELMVAGDSAVFRLPVDSLRKIGGAQPWMKNGDYLDYNVSLLSVKTDSEFKKDNAEKSARQNVIDDKLLQDYFAKNKIKPLKTASGLYYTISQDGIGENVKPGQTIYVKYIGKLLNGMPFDSNMDTSFHHTDPLIFEVGKGRVIKGWDEGLLLLKKGSKATFYIPSNLAYGPQERKPIPADAILIFDVDIQDIENPMSQSEKDDKNLREYFEKNNIKATKTASGLYYRIIKEGAGENAKPGQKVSMGYLGKTLDGKVFDGNIDDKFNSKKPAFTFNLGVGQVIKGWDEGVQLLNKGSRATLYIPSGLAYGERGAGNNIPPNADLIFDVEVMDIAK